jgi:DHA2 family multidrug resistance protein
LWLQQYMGYTATQAGMILAPVGLFALLLSPVVGKNMGKMDPRQCAVVAFVIFALVLWMRSKFNTEADFATIMVPTLIQGIAMAFFFIPLVSLTLSEIPHERMPSASGVSNFARITAGSFGTSIATTVWQDRATLHHAQLAEAVNQGSAATNATLSGLASAGLSTEQALASVNRLVDQQAYMLAASDVFYASALIFLALIPLVFLGRHHKAGATSADAAAGAH